MMPNFVVRIMFDRFTILKKLSTSALFVLTTAICAFAQPYGNEWIDFNQTYYKFKIAETGVYQINRDDLLNSGFPVSSVPASRIQLFRNGEELSIDVEVLLDGTLDHFRFYGQGNDGAGDKDLYVNPNAQINPKYSLFSDSASYFITYYLNSQSGKRIPSYSEANSGGLSAADYQLHKVDSIFFSNYGRGRKYGTGNKIESSSYDYGEGWTGSYFKLGNTASYAFNLEHTHRDGPSPSIRIQLVGGNNNLHDIEITAGPDVSNQRTITNAAFGAFDSFIVEESLAWSDVAEDGSLVIQATPNGVNGAADRISIAFIELDYPQAFEMDGSNTKEFNLQEDSEGKTFIRVNNPPSGVTLLDISEANHPISIGISQSTSNFIGMVRDTEQQKKLFAYSSPTVLTKFKEVSFESIQPANFNYLIISHPDLRTGDDPVDSYGQYRTSEIGGGYAVHISEIQDLFDQFNYGDPSPISIRRYADFMMDGGDPKYLFIIGKGTTVNGNYYRRDPATTSFKHFIPTFGLPGSDVQLTAGLNEFQFAPAIPTGRINVLEKEQINDYLNKVIEMESAPYDHLWRKNTLHLSGGKVQSEQAVFKAYIDQFSSVVTGDFLGANNKSLSKETTDEVEFISVANQINAGLSLVTFFGHSSSSTADIEIGNVSDPIYGYRNEGRYPVFLINGCNAGAVYNASDFIGWGDDWILTPDLGAVAFIASVDRAFSSNLKRFSDLFYRYSFGEDENFGKGVGDAIQSSARDFIQLYGSSNINIAQIQQFALNGDPAVKIFGANRPDFEISESDVTFSSLNNELILTTTDSFYVQLNVTNFGRSVKDSLDVSITRTLADGTVINYDVQKFERVLSQDSIQFVIKADPTKNEGGKNIFNIQIDPFNTILELDDENNSVTVELDIFTGSTVNLHPLNFGIVPDSKAKLIFQTSDILSEQKNILIEIDTSANFNSPWKSESSLAVDLIGNLEVDLNISPLTDGAVFYWRTKLQNPEPNESNEWVESSFTYIKDSPSGWMQSSGHQLDQTMKTGITVNENKNWEFESNSSELKVETYGADRNDLSLDDIKAVLNDFDFTASTIFTPCSSNTLNVLVFNRRSTSPYQAIPIIGDDVFNRLVCGRRPQVLYNFLEKDVTGTDTTNSSNSPRYLSDLITRAEEGDLVAVFNMGKVNFSKWDSEVLSQLNKIGVDSNDITALIDGQPVIIFGKKGSAIGTATIVSNNGTIEPILEQVISFETSVTGSAGEGLVRSLKIGPASSWLNFQQSIITSSSNDGFYGTISGIDEKDQRLALYTNVTSNDLEISSIDAAVYPHLELEVTITDVSELTAPQLDEWKILFEEVPDGILIDKTMAVSVNEGEETTLNFGFYNYTNSPFAEDLEVIYTIFNQERRTSVIDTITISSPLPGDTTTFQISAKSIGMSGLNDLSIRVNTNKVPELLTSNNAFRKIGILTVNEDNINPVVDVTFNGKRIKNGELVPTNPSIVARLRDNNEFILKQDTLGILLFYQAPCDSNCTYEQIYFDNNELEWSPATASADFEIKYRPTNLIDGWHGIRIQAEDATGNQIGSPFEINFTIFKEPSLYNFRAFPNPFSDGIRFAFTLSGENPPDDMILEIFNIHGKKMRTISIAEIEKLKIGENITDFIWDGTDITGTKLSNGIYFYNISVISSDDQKAYSQFENSKGRMVLMR